MWMQYYDDRDTEELLASSASRPSVLWSFRRAIHQKLFMVLLSLREKVAQRVDIIAEAL
ncbi:MAG: hypothetical protein QOJ98_3104 [Acidobacteriota bacterium]|jgi:hypothetical protein|nr:hypothetical protein [Acidobacteriota bacterium]